MTAPGLRIGGLFEGYGGLTMAVQSVLGGTVAWHSEIDPDASRILTHHWPDVPNLGDITKIDWSQVEPVDVLTLGFPCQDLSTAGSRHGMTPTNRSGLWSHAAYAISQLRPSVVVVENVRGLLTSRGAEPTEELLTAWAERDRLVRIITLIERKRAKAIREGKDFYVRQHTTDRLRFLGRHRRAVAAVRRADARIVRAIGTVLGDLARLGFDAQWCGLRAADVGAPHGRFRIFVVAHPSGQPWSVGHGDDVLARGGTDRRGPAAGQGVVTDTGSEHGQQRRVAAPGQAPGRRSLGELAGRGRASAADADIARSQGREPARRRHLPDGCAIADASGDGRDEGRPEPARLIGGSDAALSGDAATDTDRAAGIDGPRRGSDGASGTVESQARSRLRTDLASGPGLDWGQYAPAIARWERVLGRAAPAPTEPGAKGGQRLSPRFVEWMQGLPAGHVTDPAIGISRNAQLKALGNGVVPQQAAAAVRLLLASIAQECAA